jgi:phosphoglycolate phosphatase-like HAD superfamily hydrolase/transcriptional regulator with XRE-family HTH domain
MEIRERILQLLNENGITQKELAEKSGVGAVTISRILNGHFQPKASTLSKIADVFGLSLSEISEDDSFGKKTFKGVRGYVEYLGKIQRIESFKNLEDFYLMVKHNIDTIPVEAKEIRAANKTNSKNLKDAFADINEIDFFKNETYDAAQIKTWSFRKSEDERDEQPNNLGNMCAGYPFILDGEEFLNSEAAYICGMFSDNTPEHISIQRELQIEPVGYNTKKVIRRAHESEKRSDWESFNVQWMLYVVWSKCQNESFARVLKSIPKNTIIIENSTHQSGKTALFWGATNQELEDDRATIESEVEIFNPYATSKTIEHKKMEERNKINDIGKWAGTNCMGKILTVCKWHLEHNTTPSIDYELLKSKDIHLFGKLLRFTPPSDMQHKRIPTVIFDFDKTLVDTRPLDQYSHLYRGKERFSEGWKRGIKEYISHLSECRVYEGIQEVLDYIRGNRINIIVVTAGIKMKVMEAAKLFGWTDIINNKNTFGRHSFGLQKKVTKKDGNPMLFEKALSNLGVEAKDCISFGNEYDDTIAAQEVGIRAYNCLWGATKEDADRMMIDMPQITIENPIEIIDIIKGEAK